MTADRDQTLGRAAAASAYVDRTIDQNRLCLFQWKVLILCGLCVFLDGFDIQSIGFVAPAIASEWGLKPTALGSVFAAGLFGMIFGSAILGSLADRFGRRPLLICATALAGATMLLTSQARNVDELVALRFVTGVGLGSLIPNVVALTSEYSPARIRTGSVVVVGAGLTLGAAVGGGLIALIIPAWGWRGVFVVGGVTPLLLSAAMIFALPESLRLLVQQNAAPERIRRLVIQLWEDLDPQTPQQIIAADVVETKASVAELFRRGRARTTVILWIVAFMMLLEFYFLSSWLPSVIRGAGYSLQVSIMASTMLQVGGVAGSLVIAVLGARISTRRVLAIFLCTAAIAIALIGRVENVLPALIAVVFAAGIAMVGSLPALNAVCGDCYPTAMRSTGVGWMYAFGRTGSIVGPIIGGVILQSHLGDRVLFMFAAAPALAAAVGFWLLYRIGEAPPSFGLSDSAVRPKKRTV